MIWIFIYTLFNSNVAFYGLHTHNAHHQNHHMTWQIHLRNCLNKQNPHYCLWNFYFIIVHFSWFTSYHTLVYILHLLFRELVHFPLSTMHFWLPMQNWGISIAVSISNCVTYILMWEIAASVNANQKGKFNFMFTYMHNAYICSLFL